MFAIYDAQGCRFRDTLENLRKVKAPNQSEAANARYDAAESDELTQSSTRQKKFQHETPSEKAVSAYRQTRNLSSREQIYHAHQVMSSPVGTLDIDSTMVSAWERLQELDVRQVPVVNVKQTIVGMLSLEDLLKFLIVDGTQVQYLPSKSVSDAMSRQVLTADPVTDIRRIAQLMQEYRLHAVPVVNEQDVLVGIVSRTDILRVIANNPPLSLWT